MMFRQCIRIFCSKPWHNAIKKPLRGLHRGQGLENRRVRNSSPQDMLFYTKKTTRIGWLVVAAQGFEPRTLRV